MSPTNSAATLINSVQDVIHAELAPLLAPTASYVLFDFPDHNNVGDSAIFLGELAYLRRRFNTAPVYTCRADQCDYDRLSKEYKDALILIHGGGNFGDIWPWHHERREALLERFPERAIIQLPQTIMFESQTALKRTAQTIKRHQNFTLLVRDQRSFEFANAEFDCTVSRCPDMAFCMGPLQRIAEPLYELLLLLRNDQESSPRLGEISRLELSDFAVADWRMDKKPTRAARKLLALGESLWHKPSSFADADSLRNNYFHRLAEKRVQRGLRLLSSGKFLITDRLHAYILALLLDVPRAVIDNSYGKISGFIDTWMQGDNRVPTVGSIEEAISIWRQSVRLTA